MFYQFLHSKLKITSTLMGVILCLFLSSHSTLEATTGFGKSEEVVVYEGATFNGIYFDTNGLHFVARIPNYSGVLLQNGEVKFNSTFEDGSGYLVTTALNPNFSPPNHLNDFIKLVQDSNPTYIVHPLKGRDYGAFYCVDLIPKSQNDNIFWRIVCTKHRLVKMATNDKNEKRRFYFFESIYVNKH